MPPPAPLSFCAASFPIPCFSLWKRVSSCSIFFRSLPLSEAQAREIGRRLAAYRQDGDRGMPWEEFEEQLDAE
jgi:putative addiction module component (TIGR02574 family)